MDLRKLFENVDSRITSRPGSTAQSLAQELEATVQDIEKAVREVDGVSFHEYRENKRLAHALKALEEERSPIGGRIHQAERVQPRLTITGATVRYLLLGGGIYKSEFSNSYPIVDLSTAGMAFLADRPAKTRQESMPSCELFETERIPPLGGPCRLCRGRRCSRP